MQLQTFYNKSLLNDLSNREVTRGAQNSAKASSPIFYDMQISKRNHYICLGIFCESVLLLLLVRELGPFSLQNVMGSSLATKCTENQASSVSVILLTNRQLALKLSLPWQRK